MDFIVYLFGVNPPREFQYLLPTLIATAVFILIGFGIKYYCKRDKPFRKLFRNSGGNFISIGFIGLILVAARDQGIPFISMRFLLALTLFIGLYLIGKTIIRYRKEYPKLIAQMKINKNTTKKKTYSHSKKKK